MRFEVRVKTGARRTAVSEAGTLPGFKGTYPVLLVEVRARPIKGQANRAVLRALAEHFGMPISRVRIVAGLSSHRKIVELYGGS